MAADKPKGLDDIAVQHQKRGSKSLGDGPPPSRTDKRNLDQPETIAGIDGRTLKATGRTAQFNTRVTPEWKREVKALAANLEITQGELLEQMLDIWKKYTGRDK